MAINCPITKDRHSVIQTAFIESIILTLLDLFNGVFVILNIL